MRRYTGAKKKILGPRILASFLRAFRRLEMLVFLKMAFMPATDSMLNESWVGNRLRVPQITGTF